MSILLHTRTVEVGPLTVRVQMWADDCCEHEADDVASLIYAMADEDEAPTTLAEKIANRLKGLRSVEVIDEEGDGALVYSD